MKGIIAGTGGSVPGCSSRTGWLSSFTFFKRLLRLQTCKDALAITVSVAHFRKRTEPSSMATTV
jgi:hypothetical protein